MFLQPEIPSSKLSANKPKFSASCSKLIITSSLKITPEQVSQVKKIYIKKILKGAEVITQSALKMKIGPKKKDRNVKQNNVLKETDTFNEQPSTSKVADNKRKRKNVTTEKTINYRNKGKTHSNSKEKASKETIKKKKRKTYIESSSENSDILNLTDTDDSEYETFNDYMTTCLNEEVGKKTSSQPYLSSILVLTTSQVVIIF